MIKRYYDEQRVVVIGQVGSVLRREPYKKDSTYQDIAREWEMCLEPLDALVKFKKQATNAISVDDADEGLDASAEGYYFGLKMVERLAVAQKNKEEARTAAAALEHIFKEGVSPITRARPQAEIGQIDGVLARSKETAVVPLLKAHIKDDVLALLEDRRNDMQQALNAVQVPREEQKKLVQAAQEARKQFDAGLSRLLQYVNAKYNWERKEEKALAEAILTPIEQAYAAAQAEYNARAAARAKEKKEKPQDPADPKKPQETPQGGETPTGSTPNTPSTNG